MIQWLWLLALPPLAAMFLVNDLTLVRLIGLGAGALLVGWGLWLWARQRQHGATVARLRQDLGLIKEELHSQRLTNVDLMRSREKLDEQRRNGEAQLEQQRQLVNSLPAAVIIASPDGRIVQANATVEQLTGWKPANIIGKNWNDIFNDPSSSASVVREKLLAEAPSYANEQDCIKGFDGREVLGSSYLWRIKQDQLGWAFLTRSQAVDYDKLRDEFVTNISHELRTPLTVIKGYAEILYEDAASSNSQSAELLKIIVDEGDRLSTILDGIINYQQASMGQIGLRHESVNIVQLLGNVATDMEPMAKNKRITLERKIPESLSPCKGDFTALRFAFSHLLDNAIKFTPEGGKVTIETGGWRLEDALWKLEVHVEDTGIGIDVKDLPHIFDRFYRTDQKVHTRQGTGIGLSVVKEIIETHSGTISVESTPGKGSRFTVRLPMTG